MDQMHSTTISASSCVALRRASPGRLIAATTLGNGLEFFDFTVYSFFAVIIGKLFFPHSSAQGQLLLAVASFGVGFVSRPLGGLLIGMYADKVGRKAAMVLTLGLMALGTGMIAFTPTYAQIGIAAPIIMVLGRLIQGFSAGGEVGASTTLLAELAPAKLRGLYSSFQFSSQGAAALLGALTGWVLTSTLSVADLESWGWRIPFILGVLIAPLGLYIRKTLDEPEAPRSASSPAKMERNPLISALRQQHRMILAVLGAVIGGTSTHYIVMFYMSTYAVKVLGLAPSNAMLAGIMSGVIMTVAAPLGGLLSDRVGRIGLAQATRVLLILAIYPAFYVLINHPSTSTLLGVIALLAIPHAINAGGSAALLAEVFPREMRATGGAIVYSLGVAVFGGFAQLIVTWLIGSTGSPFAPAWYMIGCGLLSVLAQAMLPNKAGQSLD